nr:reverse transcriptase domain-containing protein [Tanacetum cinerariifolium]
MDLKTQLETIAKNHQASIQNLETKFDRLADKQFGQPSGSLPSNTQPNPKGHNSKAYQPLQARNEHVNVVFTRSAENMLVEVGKFTFPADFVILEMEEDRKSFEKITINTNYKIQTSLEEPPTDLELKPLPDDLEYVFLEEPSFLPVIISSQLFKEKKNKRVSVLKKHKQAFSWKTTDIPGIFRSFCKHKIQLLDDKKPVVQKQRRYFQILIDPNDQEKTTFTYPFETYAYRRLPFSLCNAPATFQRDAHLVLNWEKCHLMVKEGIMLGDKVSSAGLEVDKAKVDVISKLPPLPILKGIDFMGPFPKSYKFEYILVDVDYVSKWAEGQALPTNDARVVVTFLKILFCHFGMPKALISDRGTHFCNKITVRTMKNGIKHHFSKSYHPQTSGQVENTIKALQRILEKFVKDNPVIWSRKLDDALWAFRIANKTPTDLIAAGEKRMFQLHELDELRHQAYENSRLYKERTKVWHDRKLRIRKEFKQGNKVLLFHSKYKFKQPKPRSRWLDKENQEVKNVVEQPAERGNRIIQSLQNFRIIRKSSTFFKDTSQISPVYAIDNDSQREEMDIVTSTDELLPPSVENDDDSEGEINVVEELHVDNSIFNSANEFFDNEASDFDNPSVSLPHPEPPDEEFDFEIDSGKEISVVMNDIVEFECLDPNDKFDVSNDGDVNFFPFIIVIYFEVFSFLLSAESEDTIFDPGISIQSQWMNDLLDDNNFFIFDDVNVRISPVSKMPFRKKPRDSMHIVQICLWIIDSGCSKHMTGNPALLMNFVEKFLGTVRFGNNDFAVIAGYEDVVIGSMTIKKVYYVEGLGHNLFSIGQFCDKGLEVAF